MAKSRRQFLTVTSMGVLGAAAALRSVGQNPAGISEALPPGAPPAFGAGPPVGPEVSATTFAEAEKLVQFEMTPAERAVAAGSWRKTMAYRLRAAHRAAQTRVANDDRSRDALESDAARTEVRSRARPIRPQLDRSRPRCLPATRTLPSPQ